MRGKRLLTAFFLGVGLCFVPALGHGEVIPVLTEEVTPEQERYFKIHFPDEPIKTILRYTRSEHPTYFRFYLLEARLNYMMTNPNNFACVFADYDNLGGALREIHKLPEGVETKGKVLITVYDKRGAFSYKSGTALLEAFKQTLVVFYSYLDVWVTDMDADIVAKFYSKEDIPLGYFYQGEYYLWEE